MEGGEPSRKRRRYKGLNRAALVAQRAGWACPACTLNNAAAASVCAVCGAARPARSEGGAASSAAGGASDAIELLSSGDEAEEEQQHSGGEPAAAAAAAPLAPLAPLAPAAPAAPSDYLADLDASLDAALGRNAALFDGAERAALRGARALPESSRRLLARLSKRKGSWFRAASLEGRRGYEGCAPLPAAMAALRGAGVAAVAAAPATSAVGAAGADGESVAGVGQLACGLAGCLKVEELKALRSSLGLPSKGGGGREAMLSQLTETITRQSAPGGSGSGSGDGAAAAAGEGKQKQRSVAAFFSAAPKPPTAAAATGGGGGVAASAVLRLVREGGGAVRILEPGRALLLRAEAAQRLSSWEGDPRHSHKLALPTLLTYMQGQRFVRYRLSTLETSGPAAPFPSRDALLEYVSASQQLQAMLSEDGVLKGPQAGTKSTKQGGGAGSALRAEGVRTALAVGEASMGWLLGRGHLSAQPEEQEQEEEEEQVEEEEHEEEDDFRACGGGRSSATEAAAAGAEDEQREGGEEGGAEGSPAHTQPRPAAGARPLFLQRFEARTVHGAIVWHSVGLLEVDLYIRILAVTSLSNPCRSPCSTSSAGRAHLRPCQGGSVAAQAVAFGAAANQARWVVGAPHDRSGALEASRRRLSRVPPGAV